MLKTPGAIRPPTTTPLSDAELVTRCCEGDRQAWRTLFEKHGSTVYRFLAALGVPETEREDVCQEVFLAVYRSLGRFRGEAQLSTWIYRIAARGAGRTIERRRLRDLLSTVLQREPEPPPADPTEQSDRARFLHQILARLSPKKRLVFVLFEIEGLPIEEIARVVGCPTNTVWSRLHHARQEVLRLAAKTVPASRAPGVAAVREDAS